jgi:hypothetical protein
MATTDHDHRDKCAVVGLCATEFSKKSYDGMPVRVRFEDVESGVTIPQWEPVPEA